MAELGRKPVLEFGRNVSVRLEGKQVSAALTYANRKQVCLSEALRELISLGLCSAEFVETPTPIDEFQQY